MIKKIITCMDCGKEIEIEILKNGTILGDVYYYGKWRPEIGNWASHAIKDGEYVRIISRWKELYYKLGDLKRVLLKQYTENELWVCKECEETDEEV